MSFSEALYIYMARGYLDIIWEGKLNFRFAMLETTIKLPNERPKGVDLCKAFAVNFSVTTTMPGLLKVATNNYSRVD